MRCVLLLCLFLVPAIFADSHLSKDKHVVQARKLVERGHAAEALTILRALPPDHPDRLDINFLIGLAALNLSEQSKDQTLRTALLNEAITAFRSILVKRPQLIRVRLELARSFFLKGDDELAVHHFDIVLAGNIAPVMRTNIRRFMSAIEARRRWRGYFNVSLAPEQRIEQNRQLLLPIFDTFLPFTLSEPERSGNGLIMQGGGSYTYPFASNWRLISGVALTHKEYAGDGFDSSAIRLYTGPRYIFSPGSHIGLSADLHRDFNIGRHAGSGDINDTYSIRAYARRRVNSRFSLNSSVSFKRDRFGNGPDKYLTLGGKYFISPVIAADGAGGVSFERPKQRLSHKRSRFIRGSLSFILPYGISSHIEALIRWENTNNRQYVLSGDKRSRRLRNFQIGLLHRELTIFGFSPQITFVRQLSESNYQLDNYKSNAYQLTFQRQF